jgi:L-threonylcarbamoyladenylate synthase
VVSDLSASVRQAAQALALGELIGLPTETVYGLAADALNPKAVATIFSAKGRPADHPLIVHVADASQVAFFASSVPFFASQLMAAFWPGPLTLILPLLPLNPIPQQLHKLLKLLLIQLNIVINKQ